jgi:uncharacterized short protein YbdD (DUF466 family)
MIARLRQLLGASARVLRAIAGVPDYDRYVAHMHARHPGTAPLPIGDFLAERQRERFERPGSRCC